MAEVDIGPELYAEIDKQYKAALKNDAQLKAVAKKINAKRATHADVSRAAERLGKHASDALKAVLTPDRLPDGVLYWNIAEKTIKPVMTDVNEMVNALAMVQKRATDKVRGLNIGLKEGVRTQERINTLMGLATTADTPEALNNALDKAVRTTALDYLDDFEEKNAEIRSGMGLKQYVVREYDGVGLNNGKEPCQWCLDRAGTWTYEEAEENGVFERHEGCGCSIEVVYEEDLSKDVKIDEDIPF